MMRFYAIGFTVLALIDTTIQVSFKLAGRRTGEFSPSIEWVRAAITEPWIYVAIAGYLVTLALWMTLLKRAPLGPAFVASHLQVVTVLAASVLLFHEVLRPREIAGAVCIIAGIAVLAFSDARTESPH